MTFADIPSGESVFLDANVFVYNFGPDPVLGGFSIWVPLVVPDQCSAFRAG